MRRRYWEKRWHKSKLSKRADLIIFTLLFFVATVLAFNWYGSIGDSGRKSTAKVAKTPKKEFSQKDHIISSNGDTIVVVPGAVKGYLGRMVVNANDHVEFRGWAFDITNSQIPEAILITYDEKSIYWGQNNFRRPDVAKLVGNAALNSGFVFVLPLRMFKENELERTKVRIFAISNGVASELKYARGIR